MGRAGVTSHSDPFFLSMLQAFLSFNFPPGDEFAACAASEQIAQVAHFISDHSLLGDRDYFSFPSGRPRCRDIGIGCGFPSPSSVLLGE